MEFVRDATQNQPRDVNPVERRRRSDMAFIHEGSCECTKSELDLFSVPPTQTSIEIERDDIRDTQALPPGSDDPVDKHTGWWSLESGTW